MKRILLVAVALSMAAPMLPAQAAPIAIGAPEIAPNVVQVTQKTVVTKKVVTKHDRHKVVVKKKVVKKPRWSRGQRYSDWRRHTVRDYHRHGLRAPGRGQQWVKVDNDFLLVTAATGVIASIIAAR